MACIHVFFSSLFSVMVELNSDYSMENLIIIKWRGFSIDVIRSVVFPQSDLAPFFIHLFILFSDIHLYSGPLCRRRAARA